MSKKYANVDMVKTTDPEGCLVISSYGIDTTFDRSGTLTHNNHNDVVSWNSGTITHLNFLMEKISIMFDGKNGIITITDQETDKNIWIKTDVLKDKIDDEGLTIEAMEMILKAQEKENENNG